MDIEMLIPNPGDSMVCDTNEGTLMFTRIGRESIDLLGRIDRLSGSHNSDAVYMGWHMNPTAFFNLAKIFGLAGGMAITAHVESPIYRAVFREPNSAEVAAVAEGCATPASR